MSGNFVTYLWQTFWWLRGVAAAIFLVKLVPEFVDVSELDFLKALLAIASYWDEAAKAIAEFLSELLRLPFSIDPVWVDIVFFWSVFPAPTLFAVIYSIEVRRLKGTFVADIYNFWMNLPREYKNSSTYGIKTKSLKIAAL